MKAVPPLSANLLVAAYRDGYFPMAHGRSGPIRWYNPDPRAILPLDGLHVSRSLRRRLTRGGYTVTCDANFQAVMRGCAEPRRAEDADAGTWISEPIIAAYCELHRRGLAHSVEAWSQDASSPDGRRLVGGVYGVTLGGAFFGESMFSRASDASKVCLVHLVEHLNRRGFTLFDTQFTNPHLATLGVIEIPRDEYLARLRAAVAADAYW